MCVRESASPREFVYLFSNSANRQDERARVRGPGIFQKGGGTESKASERDKLEEKERERLGEVAWSSG